MNLYKTVGASLAIIAFSMVAFGQTATPPATCTTPPTSLTALDFERAIPLSNILTTLTPNAPAGLLASIAAGAIEIRERLIYNAQLGTVTSTLFTVASGTALPTPNFDFSTGVVQVAILKVNEIVFGCSPLPSALIVGTLTSVNGVLGSATNAPAVISIGYTTDNPPKINNVAEVVAALAVAWSAAGTGTFTVQAPSNGGGGTPGTGPTIVVKFADGTIAIPNTTTQAATSPFLLDASSSTGSGALTYKWETLSNSPVAFVNTGVNGQILVQFPAAGDYGIKLIVRDASGASSTFNITLQFIGRPQ